MAMMDLIDVVANPRLMADLENRCRTNLNGLRSGTRGSLNGTSGPPPFVYTDEPVDKWSAFSVAADRFPGQSVIADCDDLVGPWGAFWKSRAWDRKIRSWLDEDEKKARRVPLEVGVGISQPNVRPCCTGASCGERGKQMCGHGMAHTFNVLLMSTDFSPEFDFGGALVDGSRLADHCEVPSYGRLMVWDGSVAAGMRRPSPDFYGSGETSVEWMSNTK